MNEGTLHVSKRKMIHRQNVKLKNKIKRKYEKQICEAVVQDASHFDSDEFIHAVDSESTETIKVYMR